MLEPRLVFRTATQQSSSLARLGRRVCENMEAAGRRLEVRLGAYEPRDDDIYVVSAPKSGTTWVQAIMFQLVSSGAVEDLVLDDFSPMLEDSNGRSCHWIASMPHRRVLKTHLPPKLLSLDTGRYVYVVRDGRDVLLSYWHILSYWQDCGDEQVSSLLPRSRRGGGDQGLSLESAFQSFLSGHGWVGKWFDHVAEWRNENWRQNILYVRYEDLHSNFDDVVSKIASHCGIQLDAELMARVRERTSIQFMRANQMHFTPGFHPNVHIRAGKAAGWREIFGQEQNEQFEAELSRRGIKDAIFP